MSGESDEQKHPAASGSSIYPIGFAGGVAVLLLGLVMSWWLAAVGAGVAAAFGLLWVRSATAGYRRPQEQSMPPTREPAIVEEESPERFGRNVFLERTTLALGVLIGAAVTVPVVGFAVAPAFTDQGDEEIDLGPLGNFPEGQFVVATFTAFPREGEVSRRTAFVRNNGLLNGVPSFTILSSRCVHLGCPTQPNGPTDFDTPVQVQGENNAVLLSTQPAGFGCPCHGAQYDNEGNRTAGPPVRALDRYRYSIINGRLVLGEVYSVGKVVGTGADAQIEAYARRYPGQHVDGWERAFYPWPAT